MKICIFLILSMPLYALDFNFQKRIETESDASAYTLELTEDIYRNVRNKELRDIRIFNGEQEPVPMRLVRKSDMIEHQISKTSLPLFTINETQRINVKTKQVRITQSGNTEDYLITTSESLKNYLQKAEIIQNNTFYIDASSLAKKTIHELEFEWKFDHQGNRIFFVDIDASNNLTDWTRIIKQRKLVDISINNQKIYQNTINMNKSSYDYYRLRFTGIPKINILKATAVLTDISVSNDYEKLSFTDLTAARKNEIIINTQGYFPVEEIQIHPKAHSFITGVKIYTRQRDWDKWKFIAKDNIFSLEYEGEKYLKNTIKIARNSDSFWKFEFNQNINQEYFNEIQLKWRPYQIQFIAQGKPPFTLYAGNSRLKKFAENNWYEKLPSDLRNKLFSSHARLNKETIKSLPSQPLYEDKQMDSINYKQWVFWSLLSLILLFLSVVSVKLLKDSE